MPASPASLPAATAPTTTQEIAAPPTGDNDARFVDYLRQQAGFDIDAGLRLHEARLWRPDQQPPAVDGLWPGQVLTIGCISELSYRTSGGAPARNVVAGSSRTEGSYTFYRPSLTMRVVSFNTCVERTAAFLSSPVVTKLRSPFSFR